MKASAPPNDTGSARHQRPASTVEEGLRLVLATTRRSLIAKIATKGSHCSRHTRGAENVQVFDCHRRIRCRCTVGPAAVMNYDALAINIM